MDNPSTVQFMDQNYHKVTDIKQLTRNGKKRRIGLKFWVRFTSGNQSFYWMYEVTKETDRNWLKAAVDLGSIYISQYDFDMIQASLRKTKQ